MPMNRETLATKPGGPACGQTTPAKTARLMRTFAAIIWAGATLPGVVAHADEFVTLNELNGMTCTGGPPFLPGITISFDKDGIIYDVVGKGPPARGMVRDSFHGMLTYLSPDGATFSFEKLSGNTLTGYGMYGAQATWHCSRGGALAAH